MPLYGHFSLHMDRSPGFGSTAYDYHALLRLGFPSAPVLQYLNLAAHRNSLARSTKSMRSLALPPMCKHEVSGSLSLPSRGPFHLSLTVLFAIGHWVVFRLGGRSPRLQTGFHVSGPTLDTCPDDSHFAYGSFTLSARTFQSCSAMLSSPLQVRTPGASTWFGLFPVRSPLLGKSMFLSLPKGT